MRLWPGRRDEDVGGVRGRTDALLQELTQRFSPDAASELRRRGWSPTSTDEHIAYAIATGYYGSLTRHGDRAVLALNRSAFRHRWCPEAVQVLLSLGTPDALDTLARMAVQAWRDGHWHEGCQEALRDPYVLATLVAEFHATLDERLARVLAQAGWAPSTAEDYVAMAIASGDYAQAASYGVAAVPVLTNALAVVNDSYAILEALADTHTPEGAAVVLQALQQQWARGVSRWTDSQVVARCGGAVVGPLLDLLQSDPMHAVLASEMLAAVMGDMRQISDEDLCRIASMPDPVHLYQLPDDSRTYQGTIDCSQLRAAAQQELARRGHTFP